MGNKLTTGEKRALILWAAWITTPAGERAKIEASVAWQVAELVAELEAVASAKGREIEIPDPLFVRELLEALETLEVSPPDFFAGVLHRWQRRRPVVALPSPAGDAKAKGRLTDAEA